MYQSKKRVTPTKKHWLLDRRVAAVIIILVLLGFGFWFFTYYHKDTTVNVVSPKETQGNTLDPKPATPAAADNPKDSTETPTPDPATPTAPPKAPYGTFVSNHKLSLDDPAASLCNTTPGATCKITFTKGDTVKTLDAKQAGNDGIVEWNWTPKSLGLTSGSWIIEATASQKDQSAVTKDPTALEVK